MFVTNDERLTTFWVSVTGPWGIGWHLLRFLTLKISIFSLCFNNSVKIMNSLCVLFCCKHKWLWRLLPSAPYAGGLAAIDWNIMRSLCYLWVGWAYKKALLFLLNMYGQEKGNPLLSEERKEWCTILPCTHLKNLCCAIKILLFHIWLFFFIMYNSHSLSSVHMISHFRIQNHHPQRTSSKAPY